MAESSLILLIVFTSVFCILFSQVGCQSLGYDAYGDESIYKLFVDSGILLAVISGFFLHLQHLPFRMALLPFYLPKRVWKWFFRSEGNIFEKDCRWRVAIKRKRFVTGIFYERNM
jgi:hypothetical protein